MKKGNKKLIIIIIVALLVIVGLGFATYKIVNDENKLNVEEKEWITENINIVQNINIPNNLDIFGKNASGVFFDFIKDLETQYGLNVNKITYNIGEEIGDGSFKIVNEAEDNDIIFHQEHYVIVSKEKANMSSVSSLNNKKIGVLASDEKTITKYLNDINNTIIKPYETSTSLFEALDANTEIEFVIIPLEEYLTPILTSNYAIDFHISDLTKYFIFRPKENDTFSSIVKKYFYVWQKKKLIESINQNELKTFIGALSISDKEIDNIQSKKYTYGFINNSPYEILIGGTYGGIVSEYITRFSK